MTARVSPSSHRAGVWIWCQGEPKPYHFYLYARRCFTLAQQPSRARLDVTASDRYVLYVNGAYVGRGPARSDPRRKSYDTYDVTSRLRSGANAIAVRAYHYGAADQGDGWHSQSGNAYAVGERAGLWAELEITRPDGTCDVLGSDSHWKLQPATAWNRDVPPLEGTFGSPEVYDASADPPDWMRVEFDDSGWAQAWEIPPRELDWFLLEPRSTPLLREREVLPARLVTVGEVIDQELPAFPYAPPTKQRRRSRLDVARLLAAELRLPLKHACAERPEAVLSGDDTAGVFQGALVAGHGIRQPFLVLDFGRQVFGFPRIRLDAQPGAKLDLTYDQLLVDNRVPSRLALADCYLTRAGEQVWEVAAYRQFRYLHLTIRSPDTPVRINGVSLDAYEYPDARRWNQIAQSVRAQIRRVFWNPERGLFEDSHHHGALTGIASEHGNALAVIHGLSTSTQAERIASRLHAQDPSLAPASPAYFGDVLTALLRGGLSEQALKGVRERYRPMLELMDNPTVWEAWGPFLSHHNPVTLDEQVATRHQMRRAAPRSLAHMGGVAAGVALTTDLLGVTPTGPGFQTCRIRPRPGVLDWARGVVPTPHGDLKTAWERTATSLVLTAELPDGVDAEVTLDRHAKRPLTLVVNDRIHDLQDPDAGVQRTPTTVSVRVSAGRHQIELRCAEGGG